MTMNRTGESRFRNLADIELIDLLHTMGDGLPREVVDEILARGPRMIPYLYVIVAEKSSWTRYLPEWWAAVHATYILGAFGTQETLPALLSALRWSDAFDCEWVTEDLPSMFGRLGEPAYGPLLTIVRELPAGYGARAIALSSMAAVALKEKTLKTPFLDLAARILADATEPVPLRQAAGNILLDMRSNAHREELIRFGREESRRKDDIPEYEGVFYDGEVDEILASEDLNGDLAYYSREWLSFYDPDERERRREFWEEEQANAGREGSRGEDEPGSDRRENHTLCPCGSGKHFRDCCIKRVH